MKHMIVLSAAMLSGCQLGFGTTYADRWVDGESDILGVVRLSHTIHRHETKQLNANVEIYAEHLSSLPDNGKNDFSLNHAGIMLKLGNE